MHVIGQMWLPENCLGAENSLRVDGIALMDNTCLSAQPHS